MGKIKKILENELVGGTQTNDVYPVTSTKAVYDENNERLDKILGASQEKLTELESEIGSYKAKVGLVEYGNEIGVQKQGMQPILENIFIPSGTEVDIKLDGTLECSRILLCNQNGTGGRLKDNIIKGQTYRLTLSEDLTAFKVYVEGITTTGTLSISAQLNGKLETIDERIDGLESQINNVATDLGELESEAENKVVTITEIKEELSQKQNTIKEISSELGDKDTEEVIFCSEQEEVYASIGEYGIKAKSFKDLNGVDFASMIQDNIEVSGTTTMGKYVSNNGDIELASDSHKITTFDVSQLTGSVLITTFLLNEVKYTCFGYSNGALAIKGQLVPEIDYKLGIQEDIIDVTNLDTIKVNARSNGESHLYVPTLKSQSEITSHLFNVEKSSIVYKEIGLFLGDSIMEGVGSYYNANAVRYAEQALGADCFNLGIGGGRMAYSESRNNDLHNVLDAILDNNWDKVDSVVNNTTNEQSSVSRLEEYNRVKDLLNNRGIESVDFVMISYGFNDWNGGIQIDNDEDIYDKTTILGALRMAIKRIREKIPRARIYVACPGMAILNGESTDTRANSINKYLWEISDAIESVCKKNHIPCYNQYWCNNVDKYNYSIYLSDGVHRSVTGYKLLGKQYAKFILNN